MPYTGSSMTVVHMEDTRRQSQLSGGRCGVNMSLLLEVYTEFRHIAVNSSANMSLSLELFGRNFILNSGMWSKKCYPNILCWIQVPTCVSCWTFSKGLLFNSGMWSEKYFNLLSSVVNSNIWKVTISLKQEKWFWIKKNLSVSLESTCCYFLPREIRCQGQSLSKLQIS